jgi:hypothetical protein
MSKKDKPLQSHEKDARLGCVVAGCVSTIIPVTVGRDSFKSAIVGHNGMDGLLHVRLESSLGCFIIFKIISLQLMCVKISLLRLEKALHNTILAKGLSVLLKWINFVSQTNLPQSTSRT